MRHSRKPYEITKKNNSNLNEVSKYIKIYNSYYWQSTQESKKRKSIKFEDIY